MRNTLYLGIATIILLLSGKVFAQELTSIPDLRDRITDQVGILSPSDRASIQSKLEALEREKGSQVAILIVKTTQPESIEQYSIRVAEAWKLGRKGIDDGVLMLFAMDDRAMRIEVGYGLEGAIPDAIAKRIIDNIIIPEFRSGDYPLGIQRGTDAILDIIRGEEFPIELRDSGLFRGLSKQDEMVFIGVFGGMGLLFFTIGLVICFKTATIRPWVILGIAIAIVTFFTYSFDSLLEGFTLGIFLSGIISFINGIRSAVTSSSGLGTGVYSSSGWGSGGYSSGGGFGGGGGSFGGGGSSGRW